MVFSSHIFLFYFLPLALLLYYAAPRRGKNLLLIIISYGFYGWTNPLFTGLLLFSTLVDYTCGILLAQNGFRWAGPIATLDPGQPRTRFQRTALIISLSSNICLLGFFKYFNFGVENVNLLADALGLAWLRLDLAFKVTLPLGISFYTFQSMSYAIDVYRGRARALRNFIDFACFVSLFPMLVAGPIIRFQEIADQLRSRVYSFEKFSRGVAFIGLGLAKKILLANPCGKVADVVFGAASVGVADAWYGVTAYAFQIYFDFSGYTDMAIGLGLMLGFVLPKNFDSPYWSQSITEFWRRWHISLSTWLRDYIFTPLSYALLTDGIRNRMVREKFRFNYPSLAAILMVFTICGLWHGAAWTFVIWGFIHGSLLALEQLRGKKSWYWKMPKGARVALTFLITTLAWVFFRSSDLPHAVGYLQHMFGLGPVHENAALIRGIIYQPYYLLTFGLAAGVTWLMPQTWDWTRVITWPKTLAIFLLLALALVVLATQAYNPFIYFIF